jgi:hypothetical protein
MSPAVASRRNLIVVAVLLAAVALVVAIVVISGRDEGDDRRAVPGAGDGGSTAPTSRPDVARATGPGSCAFLSTDDVKQATGAPQVELRQTLGPNGNPGCEWALGDDRRVLQLEFQIGRTPATLPAQGEDVTGPWRAGKWLTSSRTLFVDANGQVLFVRAADNDAGRAKDSAVAVAALAARRN